MVNGAGCWTCCMSLSDRFGPDTSIKVNKGCIAPHFFFDRHPVCVPLYYCKEAKTFWKDDRGDERTE